MKDIKEDTPDSKRKRVAGLLKECVRLLESLEPAFSIKQESAYGTPAPKGTPWVATLDDPKVDLDMAHCERVTISGVTFVREQPFDLDNVVLIWSLDADGVAHTNTVRDVSEWREVVVNGKRFRAGHLVVPGWVSLIYEPGYGFDLAHVLKVTIHGRDYVPQVKR
jgi:hypothetical protein